MTETMQRSPEYWLHASVDEVYNAFADGLFHLVRPMLAEAPSVHGLGMVLSAQGEMGFTHLAEDQSWDEQQAISRRYMKEHRSHAIALANCVGFNDEEGKARTAIALLLLHVHGDDETLLIPYDRSENGGITFGRTVRMPTTP